MINNKNVAVFIRGSSDCRNPSLEAQSSEKTDSLKKDRVFKAVRSIKLFFIVDLFFC